SRVGADGKTKNLPSSTSTLSTSEPPFTSNVTVNISGSSSPGSSGFSSTEPSNLSSNICVSSLNAHLLELAIALKFVTHHASSGVDATTVAPKPLEPVPLN